MNLRECTKCLYNSAKLQNLTSTNGWIFVLYTFPTYHKWILVFPFIWLIRWICFSFLWLNNFLRHQSAARLRWSLIQERFPQLFNQHRCLPPIIQIRAPHSGWRGSNTSRLQQRHARYPTSECNFGDSVAFPAKVSDRLQVNHKSHHQSTLVGGVVLLHTNTHTKKKLEPVWCNLCFDGL